MPGAHSPLTRGPSERWSGGDRNVGPGGFSQRDRNKEGLAPARVFMLEFSSSQSPLWETFAATQPAL